MLELIGKARCDIEACESEYTIVTCDCCYSVSGMSLIWMIGICQTICN